MRKHILLIISSWLLTLCSIYAQTDWIDRTKHEGLKKLEVTDKFEVYTVEVDQTNLARTIQILEEGKVYLDSTLGKKLDFAVLFVDNQNWNTYAFTGPPGMPQAYYKGNIVLGAEESIMAKMHKKGLENAPTRVLENLKKVYGETLQLDLFFRDALALHELGHLYQFHKTNDRFQRRWLNELFGNFCQVAAVANSKVEGASVQMDAYQNVMIQMDMWGELPYKTLSQFESNYFEVMQSGLNYGWYQTQFYLIAKELYNTFGDKIVAEFYTFLIKTDPEIVSELSDDELSEVIQTQLGKEAAGLLHWKYQ